MSEHFKQLNEEDISRIYKKIQFIATLDNKNGIYETLLLLDDVINIFLSQDGVMITYDYTTPNEELKEIREKYFELKGQYKYGNIYGSFGQDITMRITILKEKLIFENNKEQLEELNKLEEEVNNLIIKAFEKIYDEELDNLLKERIHNITSIDRITYEFAKIENFYSNNNLTLSENNLKKIRKIKEQAGWYRAQKYLNSALIAKASGNEKKYNRLISEGQEQLRQDWEYLFPGEVSPEIISKK